MLTTCASPSRVVWEYYDQCTRENPSFLAMAECGRQKRLAECVPNNACSPEGNMFTQYVDTLVLSVKKKELTEAEAMRRYNLQVMSLIATGPKTLIQLESVVGMCSWCAYQLSFGNVWALPLVGREN